MRDASISDNKENRPATQDCSKECDLLVNESSPEPIATRTYTDVSAQCDLTDQRAAWMELEESVRTPATVRKTYSQPAIYLIRGDSHTRHIAGLTRGLVDSSTSVTGVCKPGARLLYIVSLPQLLPPPASTVGLDQPASPPGSRLHCEVQIAGTNDLATGAQHTIYQHLEQYITNRPADTELLVLVATMPHRYDLQYPDNPIHD
ncbi:hypothetical protein J6590_039983 [Homalodisca vitripennis]|nr:hypothetical protein J6590_039983 [Homalodisca vitripennis]